MDELLLGLAVAVSGYLAGSLPTGYLIGRLHGLDIRTVGDGNVGMMNVYRSIGPAWGYLCFAVDVAKAAVPVTLVRVLAGDDPLAMVTGAAALLGHRYPVWLGFRGGRSAASACGAVLGVAPAATGGPLALGVAILVLTKNAIAALAIGFSAVLAMLFLLRADLAVILYCIAMPAYAGLNDALDRRRAAASHQEAV